MSTTPIAVLPLDEVQRIARDAYDAGRTAGELPGNCRRKLGTRKNAPRSLAALSGPYTRRRKTAKFHAGKSGIGIFFTRRRWPSGRRVGN